MSGGCTGCNSTPCICGDLLAAQTATLSSNERVYPWRISADESPPRGVPVLCAWKRGDKWDYRVAKFTGKHWLDVIPETANERYLAPGYWQTLIPPVPAAAPESRDG